jgi:hypothetical protein
MTVLDLPEPTLLTVSLQPESRVTLGPGQVAEALRDRLSFGRSVHALDPASVDEEARVFLAGRSDSRFYLLALTVSFKPDEQNPLESAWVDVTLSARTPADAPQPVAWSMKPLTESDPVSRSRKISLDGSLKLKSDVLPIEAGPGVMLELGRSYEQRAFSVEALREGSSRPRWNFYSTEVSEIRGVHRLSLIIETGAGSSNEAEVGVGATVRLRRLKIFRYRAPLDEVPEAAHIALPPS